MGGGYPANPSPLIQSGTTGLVNYSGSDQYYFWWQIVGGQQDTVNHQITSLSVNAGDEVGAVSVWVPSNDVNSALGVAMLGVCNFTTGSCIHFNIAKVEEPGNTTEWIVETPDSYGDPYPLANYGMAGLRNSCWAPTTTLVVTHSGRSGYSCGKRWRKRHSQLPAHHYRQLYGSNRTRAGLFERLAIAVLAWSDQYERNGF
ncbi:MAG: hypothetical protein JSS42_08200 [Proteobacteria bacterium]|nr:hypothetical protein [Pseudomonadota bacterium]